MRCAVRVMPKALATLAGQALACVEDPVVNQKILPPLKNKAVSMPTCLLPEERDGPQMGGGASGIQ